MNIAALCESPVAAVMPPDGSQDRATAVGPVNLPGTGRMVWWTGRVAIGLRHQPIRTYGPVTPSELWLQGLLLNGVGERLAST